MIKRNEWLHSIKKKYDWIDTMHDKRLKIQTVESNLKRRKNIKKKKEFADNVSVFILN